MTYTHDGLPAEESHFSPDAHVLRLSNKAHGDDSVVKARR
jgi:hypothetical protein